MLPTWLMHALGLWQSNQRARVPCDACPWHIRRTQRQTRADLHCLTLPHAFVQEVGTRRLCRGCLAKTAAAATRSSNNSESSNCLNQKQQQQQQQQQKQQRQQQQRQ